MSEHFRSISSSFQSCTPFIVGVNLFIVLLYLSTLKFNSSRGLLLLWTTWNLLCNWHGNKFSLEIKKCQNSLAFFILKTINLCAQENQPYVLFRQLLKKARSENKIGFVKLCFLKHALLLQSLKCLGIFLLRYSIWHEVLYKFGRLSHILHNVQCTLGF